MKGIINLEELINTIVKEANLSSEERETFVHDLHNLRGDEWLFVVEENCSEKVVKQFTEFLGL